MKDGDKMRIILDIGEISMEKLEKLVEWLKAAPLPINPGELYTEVGIQNVKVQIKAPKIVAPAPEVKKPQ